MQHSVSPKLLWHEKLPKTKEKHDGNLFPLVCDPGTQSPNHSLIQRTVTEHRRCARPRSRCRGHCSGKTRRESPNSGAREAAQKLPANPQLAQTPSARRVRNRARGPPATSTDRPNAPEPTAVLRPGPRPQGLSRHRATPPVGRLRRRPLLHRLGIQVSVCVLTRQPQRSPRNPPPSHRSPARDASGAACCTCEQRARSLGARPGAPSSGTSPSDSLCSRTASERQESGSRARLRAPP